MLFYEFIEDRKQGFLFWVLYIDIKFWSFNYIIVNLDFGSYFVNAYVFQENWEKFYLDGFGVGNIILKYKIIGRYSSTYEDFDGDIDNLIFL